MQSCINPSRTCDTITYCIRRRETLGVRDNMHVTYIAKIGDDCLQVQLLTAPAWICAQPGDVFTTSRAGSAVDQFRKYVKKEEQNVRSIPKAKIQWLPVKKDSGSDSDGDDFGPDVTGDSDSDSDSEEEQTMDI